MMPQRLSLVRAVKRLADIEHALQWAYRDELPKSPTYAGDDTHTLPGLESWMGRLADLGCRVDEGIRDEPGFPIAMGEPCRDAVIIDAMVQGLKRFAGHTLEPDPGIADGLADVDASAAMRRASDQLVAAVITCAKQGRRPWLSGPPTPGPVPSHHEYGQPAVMAIEQYVEIGPDGTAAVAERVVRADRPRERGIYRTSRDGRYRMGRQGRDGVVEVIDAGRRTVWQRRLPREREVGRVAAALARREAVAEAHALMAAVNAVPGVECLEVKPHCPLRYEPALASIALERAQYAVWVTALDVLADELAGRLETVGVLPPAAPVAPWMGQREHAAPAFAPSRHRASGRNDGREQARERRTKAGRRATQDPVRGRRAAG